MKFLANIVTDSKKEREPFFKVVSDIKDIDERIPTLIIGWDLVKSFFPDANILDWKIKDNIFWTYKFNERNKKYREDYNRFKDNIFKKIEENNVYEYYSVCKTGFNIIERRVRWLKGNGYFYVGYNIVYIYSPVCKKTIGISLEECEYMGIKRGTMIGMLLSNGLKECHKEDLNECFKDKIFNTAYLVPYFSLISSA